MGKMYYGEFYDGEKLFWGKSVMKNIFDEEYL